MSVPLPEDHWLYVTDADGFTPRAHYPMRAGSGSKARDYLSRIIAEHGGQYGVKAATSNGRENDFDPDALVRNIEIGLFGVFTSDGLNGMGDGHLFDPVDTSSTLRTVLLETLALAIDDGLLTPEEVINGVSSHSVTEACARQAERVTQRTREYEELCIRKGWDKTWSQAEPSDDPVPEPSERQKCPNCAAPEVDASTPRTVYACGSSDYDQRPGTFEQQCQGNSDVS
jgi:hypothetical protein